MVALLWVGGGLILLLIVIGVAVTVGGERSLVDERVSRYLEDAVIPSEFGGTDDFDEDRPSAVSEWLSNRFERTSFGDKIANSLAQADMKFKVGEYIILMGICAAGTSFVAYLISGQQIAFAIMGLMGGVFLPRFYVKYMQKKRLKDFGGQLPDMLNLMVNGLRAGFSTMQSLEAVSKEMPSPIADEIRRVVQEMQLGISMEEALNNMLNRIPSEDLDLMITAMNVQREVGGNLSEILETIAHTIRERIRIKGEIETLTAQVVYSGRFLSILPVILSLVLWGVNRNYMNQFFLEPRLCGIGMLCTGAVMIVIGAKIMAMIADIEI